MKHIRGWADVLLAAGVAMIATLTGDYRSIAIVLLVLVLAGLHDVARLLREIRDRTTQIYVSSLTGGDES